jgi:hypothetical protein
MIEIDVKPDKDIEVPPYEVRYEISRSLFLVSGGCMFSHRFEWRTSPKGQYRQEVCVKCGVTGITQKVKQ